LFAGAVNKDLNGVLGNFVSRVLKMTSSKLGDVVPEGGEYTQVEEELIATLQTRVNDYIKYMNEMEFRKALGELRAIWVEGNNYISVTEPWTVIKTDEQRAKVILRACINLIRIFAVLSAPIMPTVAKNMLDKIGQTLIGLKDFDVKKEISALKGGEKFEIGDMLFERIAPEKIEELKAKYGSSK
jgi:methionyl-tRNA synthetase